MRVKLKKINQQKNWLKDKIESQNKFNKSGKEIFFKKNEDRNEKQNIWEITIEGQNWKKNTFIKGIRTK
jgi:hypothetical protein